MNILYVTSEAVPFCKTGGLADVAGSLPQSLAANGDRVSVILPLYQSVADAWRDRLHFERYTYVRLAWRSLYCGLFSYERQGVTWYFVDNEQYFKRPELYGYYDDGERFAFFCRAVTELLPLLPEKPDVVHCNDWQTALVPIYIRDEAVREEFYKSVRTVITVHNIEYQGRYGRETVEDLFGLDAGWFTGGTLAFDGDVNLLKGAIVTADAVTAVSPTYAQEIQTAYYGERLDGLLRARAGSLTGILNGIDTVEYDPETDPSIAVNYTADTFEKKAGDKIALQRQLGTVAAVGLPFESCRGNAWDSRHQCAFQEEVGVVIDRADGRVFGIAGCIDITGTGALIAGRVAADITVIIAAAQVIVIAFDLTVAVLTGIDGSVVQLQLHAQPVAGAALSKFAQHRSVVLVEHMVGLHISCVEAKFLPA